MPRVRWALFAALAVLTAAPTISAAGAKAAQVWPEEPKSIGGLELGKEFASQVLSICPDDKFKRDYNSDGTRGVCVETTPGYGTRMYGTPLNQVGNVHPVIVNGRFEGVTVEVWDIRYDECLALLKMRYGPPTSEAIGKWQNKMGATFDNPQTQWVGKDVKINLKKLGDTVHLGQLTITTAAARMAEQKQLQERVEGAAERL